MLFNSWTFLFAFFPIMFIVYWIITPRSTRASNVIIVVGSYFFYAYWDWRFLTLMIFSTLLDYSIGRAVHRSPEKWKSLLLSISVIGNLGILGYFKYYNFFVSNFIRAFESFGINLSFNTLNIILPVGISFYTFQTLSYTIDIYRNKIQPELDLISFACFVSFFPQLVAGPIEKAGFLLPQFKNRRSFNYLQASDGMKLILWGLLLKVVVANTIAKSVDFIYFNYSTLSFVDLLLGQVYFAFQLYCDFAGYSFIAMGTAQCFGFKLNPNFNYPFFSRTVQEFWVRWHISLGKWFNDYMFSPLLKYCQGKRTLVLITYSVVFATVGLWHGANWTYVLTFFTLFVYFIPRVLLNKKRRFSRNGKLNELIPIITTFWVISSHLILFRSPNVGDALNYISRLYSFSGNTFVLSDAVSTLPLLMIFFLLAIEWRNRSKIHPFHFPRLKAPIRYAIYCVSGLLVINLLDRSTAFVYFQF
jgi:alginate O-acetyltransferase complex protein AlgI